MQVSVRSEAFSDNGGAAERLENFLTPRHPVSLRVLAVYTLWVVVTAIAVRQMPRDTFAPVRDATGGLVGGTLILSLPMYFALWLIVVRWGGQRLSDLGIERRTLVQGAIGTALLWVFMQAIQVAVTLRRGNTPSLHSAWADPGFGFVLGTVLGQLLANGPYEELVYRRFYLSAAFGRLARVRPGLLRLAVAIVVTQLFFWVMHFPAALQSGVPVYMLEEKTDIILVSGFVFTFIYLLTRNVFLAAGYHALANHPTPLFAEAVNARWLTQRVGWTFILIGGLWLVVRAVRRVCAAR